MISPIAIPLKSSASLLTLTKPKASAYTCYFSECWAPTCPTHGTASREPPPEPLPIPMAKPNPDRILSQKLCHDDFSGDSGENTDMCFTPPSAGLTRSHTAPNGLFRCYAPTCEAINCPRHQRIIFPMSPPQTASLFIHDVPHLALPIPAQSAQQCPELVQDASPSSASSTDSPFLRTPTGWEASHGAFPVPTTVITHDSDEEIDLDYYTHSSGSSYSSHSSYGSFTCTPSIFVEPPSVRSSMQSVWTVHGFETDGYDGSSEMEGIPARREALAPRSVSARKKAAEHRSKGKENARPNKGLKLKAAGKELRHCERAARGLMV